MARGYLAGGALKGSGSDLDGRKRKDAMAFADSLTRRKKQRNVSWSQFFYFLY